MVQIFFTEHSPGKARDGSFQNWDTESMILVVHHLHENVEECSRKNIIYQKDIESTSSGLHCANSR